MSDFADAVLGAVDVGQTVTDVADADDKFWVIAVTTGVQLILWTGLIHLCDDGRRQRRQHAALLQDHAVSGVKRTQQRQKNILSKQ